MERYLPADARLSVQRYDRASALRQKIEALAGRTRIEARDIFDIHPLLESGGGASRDLVTRLAESLQDTTLELAHQRTLQLAYPEYDSLVVRFLEDDAREAYRSESMWDELRLRAASLLEDVQKEKGRGP